MKAGHVVLDVSLCIVCRFLSLSLIYVERVVYGAVCPGTGKFGMF